MLQASPSRSDWISKFPRCRMAAIILKMAIWWDSFTPRGAIDSWFSRQNDTNCNFPFSLKHSWCFISCLGYWFCVPTNSSSPHGSKTTAQMPEEPLVCCYFVTEMVVSKQFDQCCERAQSQGCRLALFNWRWARLGQRQAPRSEILATPSGVDQKKNGGDGFFSGKILRLLLGSLRAAPYQAGWRRAWFSQSHQRRPRRQ